MGLESKDCSLVVQHMSGTGALSLTDIDCSFRSLSVLHEIIWFFIESMYLMLTEQQIEDLTIPVPFCILQQFWNALSQMLMND